MPDSPTKVEFNPSGKPEIDEIKMRTDDLMAYIEERVPDGRRKSLALTNLEQGAMWAVKACFD